MTLPSRAIAVDWSGAKKGAAKKIWLAKVDESGLSELGDGRTRQGVVAKLVEELDDGSDLVVGLDFAFSFPSWFVEETGCSTAFDFWRAVDRDGERWIAEMQRPFFAAGGWQGEKREAYRLTDWLQKEKGQHPETVFKLVGRKQVGKGSIRGMPRLLELKEAGFNIWPFDPPKLPLVVEIFPRLFYGNVNKSSIDDRYRHLTRTYPNLAGLKLCKAAGSDDAFDAAVSAFEMWKKRSELTTLPERVSETVRIEGWIWAPSTPADRILT